MAQVTKINGVYYKDFISKAFRGFRDKVVRKLEKKPINLVWSGMLEQRINNHPTNEECDDYCNCEDEVNIVNLSVSKVRLNCIFEFHTRKIILSFLLWNDTEGNYNITKVVDTELTEIPDSRLNRVEVDMEDVLEGINMLELKVKERFPWKMCMDCHVNKSKDIYGMKCFSCFVLENDAIDCSICLETDVKKRTITTPCNHTFHIHCLKTMFQKAEIKPLKCPMCRHPIDNYFIFENTMKDIIRFT
jgi:hypothetical protein